MFERIQLFGTFNVSSFSVMMMIAFLTAAYLIPRELYRRKLDINIGDQSLLLAVVATIVGAKIGFVIEKWGQIWPGTYDFGTTLKYVLLYWEGLGHLNPKNPAYAGLWETLFSAGGLVFYGGFIAGFGTLYAYLNYKKAENSRYGDAFIPSLAVGYGIGRLGCIISGDGCFGYGASVDIPLLTMVFDQHSLVRVNSWFAYKMGAAMGTDGVNVWNTPVIEAIFSWILFAWMMLKLRFQGFRPGFMVALFLVWNGIFRFLVEFLRINDALIPIMDPPTYDSGAEITHHNVSPVQTAEYFTNWHWYGFTLSQIIGLTIAAIGGIWIWQKKLFIRDDKTGAAS